MAITTLQRISELESSVSGSITSDFSKWSRKKMINTLDEGRAAAIVDSVMRGTRIHPTWLQTLTLQYDPLIQESDCYTIFPCPSVIKLKKLTDGFVFVGNEAGTVAYGRINTRGEMLNMMNHPVLSRKITNGVGALYEDGKWYIYSDKTEGLIKSLSVRAIFNSPTELPYFNLTEDEYPIDQTTFEFALEYLKERLLYGEAMTPVTTTKTSKDLPYQKQRRR